MPSDHVPLAGRFEIPKREEDAGWNFEIPRAGIKFCVINFESWIIFGRFDSKFVRFWQNFQLCHINFQGDDQKDVWTAEDHRKWNEDWYRRRDSAHSYGTEWAILQHISWNSTPNWQERMSHVQFLRSWLDLQSKSPDIHIYIKISSSNRIFARKSNLEICCSKPASDHATMTPSRWNRPLGTTRRPSSLEVVVPESLMVFSQWGPSVKKKQVWRLCWNRSQKCRTCLVQCWRLYRVSRICVAHARTCPCHAYVPLLLIPEWFFICLLVF